MRLYAVKVQNFSDWTNCYGSGTYVLKSFYIIVKKLLF